MYTKLSKTISNKKRKNLQKKKHVQQKENWLKDEFSFSLRKKMGKKKEVLSNYIKKTFGQKRFGKKRIYDIQKLLVKKNLVKKEFMAYKNFWLKMI